MRDKVFTYNSNYIKRLIKKKSKAICAICKYPLEYPTECKTHGFICNDCNCECDCNSNCSENKYSINGNHTTEPVLSDLTIICPNYAFCDWCDKRSTSSSKYLDHYQECKDKFSNCLFCQAKIEKIHSDEHTCVESDKWLKSEENNKIVHFINKYENMKRKSETESFNKINYFVNVIRTYLNVNFILFLVTAPQFFIEIIFYCMHYDDNVSSMRGMHRVGLFIAWSIILQAVIFLLNILFNYHNDDDINWGLSGRKRLIKRIPIQMSILIFSIGITLISIICISHIEADICEYNKKSILLHYVYCCGCLLVDIYRLHNFTMIRNTLNFTLII